MAKAKVEYTIKARDESASGINSAKSNVDKLGGAIKTAFSAAAIIGAAAAIKRVGTELVAAYGAQEDAERRLATAAANNPYLDADAAQRIQDYASELQKLTTVGDEVAIAQASMLAAMGLTEDQITSTISVAADLSAGLGIDLRTAVLGLGQTFEGTSGTLGRYAPQLRGLTEEQLRAGDAIKMLDEQFGGMAADMAGTYTGAVQQFNNAWGDLKEQGGAVLADFLLPTVEAMTRLVTAMGNVNTKLDEAIPRWRELATNALASMPGVQQFMMLQQIMALRRGGMSEDEIYQEQDRWGGMSGGIPTGGGGGAGGGDTIVEILTKGTPKFKDFFDTFNKRGKKAGMGGGGSKGGIPAFITGGSPGDGMGAAAGGGMLSGILGSLGAALGPVIQAVSMLGNVFQLMQPGMVILQGLMDVIGPIINEMLEPFVIILKAIGSVIGGLLLPVLKPVAKILMGIANGFRNFINFIIKLLNKLPGVNIKKIKKFGADDETTTSTDDSTTSTGGSDYTTGRTSYNYVTITAQVVAGDGGLRELAMMIRGELESLDAIGV